jgi:hypothetical protein
MAAALAGCGYAYVAYTQSRRGEDWKLPTAAAATTVAIVPFTVLFMGKTNARLLAGAAEAISMSVNEVEMLLVSWTRLNAVRGMLPLVGGGLGLWNILS